MSYDKHLLLLNASVRKNKTSYSFTRTLKQLAEEQGWVVELHHVIEYFDEKYNIEALKESLSSSSVVGMVTPVYIDTLPYPAIWFLEQLADRYVPELKDKSFFAIGQCGFPNHKICEPVLATSKLFALRTSMHWKGGLGYGGGTILDGAHLETLGRKGATIMAALEMALQDVINGRPISPKAQELLITKIPKVLYRPLAAVINHNIKKRAREQGVMDVSVTPYL